MGDFTQYSIYRADVIIQTRPSDSLTIIIKHQRISPDPDELLRKSKRKKFRARMRSTGV